MKVAAFPAAQPAAPHVLILGAGFATDNRGVAALACGTLSAVFHSFPDAHVAFLDYGKNPLAHAFNQGGRTHRVPTVALRFSKNIFQRNHVVRLIAEAAVLRLLPASWRNRRLARHESLRAVATADLIGALSGGDSFSNLYGMRRLLYVCLPQLLILAMGRPLILLPQSYGPFASPGSRFLARTVLGRARRILSRDQAGIETVRRLVPSSSGRIAFGYDMGFALEPHPAPARLTAAMNRLRRTGPVVGLNISGLLWASGERNRPTFALKENYGAAMRDLAAFLVAQQGCSVVLIPHVFGHDGESDVTASARLRGQLPPAIARHVLLFPENLDQHEVKGLIGQCDLFAGARMHACIAALSQSVPTIALAYSDKFAGVLESIESAAAVLDLRAATGAEIRASVADALNRRADIRSELQSRIPAVRQKVLELFGADRARRDAVADPS